MPSIKFDTIRHIDKSELNLITDLGLIFIDFGPYRLNLILIRELYSLIMGYEITMSKRNFYSIRWWHR